MKFDQKYPDAQVDDEPQPCLIKCSGLMPCAICHEPTVWAEINWYGAFCSDECLDAMDRDYANWQKEHP